MEKTASINANYVASKSSTVRLSFLKNRSYELHVGNSVYSFTPYSSLDVPSSVLDHPDFSSVSHYFTIKR